MIYTGAKPQKISSDARQKDDGDGDDEDNDPEKNLV